MDDLGMDDVYPFGKYKGVEIEEILLEDPQYLLWVRDNVDQVSFDDEVNEKLDRI